MPDPADRLDLTVADLDRLIARTVAVAPHLGVVMHAVKGGMIGYCEVIDERTSRVLALRRDLPMLLLIHDQAGLGPGAFGAPEFMAALCRRSCGITIVVDHQQQVDDLGHISAVEHCIARREPVLVVETHRSAVRAWVEAAYSAGRSESEVVVIAADASRADGLQQMTLDDFTAMPPPATGPVN